MWVNARLSGPLSVPPGTVRMTQEPVILSSTTILPWFKEVEDQLQRGPGLTLSGAQVMGAE